MVLLIQLQVVEEGLFDADRRLLLLGLAVVGEHDIERGELTGVHVGRAADQVAQGRRAELAVALGAHPQPGHAPRRRTHRNFRDSLQLHLT